MYFINGIKGALFLAVLVVLIFFLKIICPINVGCLADPFLVVFFSPIFLFKITGLSYYFTVGEEAFVVLGFWTVVGFIIGVLVTPWVTHKKPVSSEN